MKKIFRFFCRPWRILLLAVAMGIILYASGVFKKAPSEDFLIVKKGTVIQQVRVTGQFKPAESVELGFERTGRVVRVSASVGDTVSAGQTLVVLDQSELSAQFSEASATVAREQAKLDQLRKGTRSEELNVFVAEIASAQVTLTEARQTFRDTVQDAYAKANDAIRNKLDSFFLNPRTLPQLLFSVSDSQIKVNIEAKRLALESPFVLWGSSLQTFMETGDLMAYDTTAQNNLVSTRDMVSTAAFALNTVVPSGSLTQATIDGWRANVSSALSSVSTAITALSAAREGFKSAEANLKVSEDKYALSKAGATPEEIAAEEAQVEQAAANVRTIGAQMAKTVLRSPINGMVTRQDAKVGEIISPNSVIVAVMSQNNLEIEANVPEVDVGKIALGNIVWVTVDALPGNTFQATLSHIDPAETVIDGVANFKIKAIPGNADARFKSGLTANLAIETLRKENVLTLPQYAILEKDAGTFVKIKSGKETLEISVTLGVRSEDGLVEVLSGVKEGDAVLNIGLKNGK